MSNALDLISAVTATVEPSPRLEDRMEKYGLDPAKATIRNGIIVEYRDNVFLNGWQLTRIPFRFSRVTKSFLCTNNHLISLMGCPKYVGGNFYCSHNKLTSLHGCPEKIKGNFGCSDNCLMNLSGGPKEVDGGFYCTGNPGSTGFKKPKGVKGEFYNAYRGA